MGYLVDAVNNFSRRPHGTVPAGWRAPASSPPTPRSPYPSPPEALLCILISVRVVFRGVGVEISKIKKRETVSKKG